MPVLGLIAWGCYALAALALLMVLGYENPFFIASAVSLAVSGVLFQAASKVIDLLTEIRDALTHGGKEAAEAKKQPSTSSAPGEYVAVRSLAELEADLERAKKAREV